MTLGENLNISNKEFIPDGFLEMPGVMENIEKASKGDANAIGCYLFSKYSFVIL